MGLIPTALELNPTDVNVLSSRLVFDQINQNKKDITLESNVTADNTEQTPKLVLDGQGRAYLIGQIKVTGSSPGANYPLLTLPNRIVPIKDFDFPVCVLRANAYVQNAVTLQTAGSTISGITVQSSGSYTTLPTFTVVGDGVGASITPIMKVVGANIQTSQSGGGSYAPGDTVEPSGGTFSTQAVFTVQNTKVQSATVASGGTGGTPGTATVTGTTGTGTKFTANVTISGGGVITAVNSITTGGTYTVNPTSLTAEPVTGGGLTGATLNIKMGILSVLISIVGSYTALPSNPVAQGATSGSGTGATFNINWGILGGTVVNGGEGYTAGKTSITISDAGGGSVTPVFSSASAAELVLINAPNQNDIVCLDGINFFVESYN